jgi:hypothetical protein
MRVLIYRCNFFSFIFNGDHFLTSISFLLLYDVLFQACVDAENVASLPGFTRDVPKKPFPPMSSHCGGYGGSQGPTSAQIARVMSAAASPVEQLADGVMQAVGGTAMKADATYNCAGRIKVDLGEGQEALIKSVNIGKKVKFAL